MPRTTSRTTKRVGKSTKKRSNAATRERIAPRGDARYVRRDSAGQFSESDDVGRSLRADRRTQAKTEVKSGQGDRGDRRRAKRKSTR